MFLIDLPMFIFLRVWYTIITPKGTETSRERNPHAVLFNSELAYLEANSSTTEQQEKFKKTLDKLRNLWYNKYVLKERTKLNTERLLPKV